MAPNPESGSETAALFEALIRQGCTIDVATRIVEAEALDDRESSGRESSGRESSGRESSGRESSGPDSSPEGKRPLLPWR